MLSNLTTDKPWTHSSRLANKTIAHERISVPMQTSIIHATFSCHSTKTKNIKQIDTPSTPGVHVPQVHINHHLQQRARHYLKYTHSYDTSNHKPLPARIF